MREQILRLVRQRPFRAFGLHLSNGTVHEVRHPELVMVSPNFVYLGVPGGEPPAIRDGFIVSILDVVQVEQLVSSMTPAAG